MTTIVRARVMHLPRDPFDPDAVAADALEMHRGRRARGRAGRRARDHPHQRERRRGPGRGRLVPWARDYLETYQRHGLVSQATVLAHNVNVTDAELIRLAAARASVANCPTSNTFLRSGVFPMRRHLDHGVRFGIGTDVGAGTGLSVLKEGLMS